MLNIKKIQLFISSLLLLISLVSLSEFTYVPTQNKKHQTELVTTSKIENKTSISKYNYKVYCNKKVLHNSFTNYNFKCLLNKKLLNVLITLKSQKEKTLQFIRYKLIEQKLIAQINTNDYKKQLHKVILNC